MSGLLGFQPVAGDPRTPAGSSLIPSSPVPEKHAFDLPAIQAAVGPALTTLGDIGWDLKDVVLHPSTRMYLGSLKKSILPPPSKLVTRLSAAGAIKRADVLGMAQTGMELAQHYWPITAAVGSHLAQNLVHRGAQLARIPERFGAGVASMARQGRELRPTIRGFLRGHFGPTMEATHVGVPEHLAANPAQAHLAASPMGGVAAQEGGRGSYAAIGHAAGRQLEGVERNVPHGDRLIPQSSQRPEGSWWERLMTRPVPIGPKSIGELAVDRRAGQVGQVAGGLTRPLGAIGRVLRRDADIGPLANAAGAHTAMTGFREGLQGPRSATPTEPVGMFRAAWQLPGRVMNAAARGATSLGQGAAGFLFPDARELYRGGRAVGGTMRRGGQEAFSALHNQPDVSGAFSQFLRDRLNVPAEHATTAGRIAGNLKDVVNTVPDVAGRLPQAIADARSIYTDARAIMGKKPSPWQNPWVLGGAAALGTAGGMAMLAPPPRRNYLTTSVLPDYDQAYTKTASSDAVDEEGELYDRGYSDIEQGQAGQDVPAAKTNKAAVEIPKADFIREHEQLVDVLRSGTPAERRTEARDQAGELSRLKKEAAVSAAQRLLRKIEPMYGGCCQDLVEGKTIDNAKARGEIDPQCRYSVEDVQRAWREHGRPYCIEENGDKPGDLPRKLASRIFLAGAVSGPAANWREPIKRKLWEAGHSVVDPKKDFAKWNPLKDIYRELSGMLKSDRVYFYRPGGFSEREKVVLDAAGRKHQTVRKPADILADVSKRAAIMKVGYQVTVPVDLRGNGLLTPSPFPEDRQGRAMTQLRAALEGDLGGGAVTQYLRSNPVTRLSHVDLMLLAAAMRRPLLRR